MNTKRRLSKKVSQVEQHIPKSLEDSLMAQKLARLESFTTLNPRPVIEVDFKGNVLDENESAKRLFPDLKQKGSKHIYLSGIEKIVKVLLREKKPFRRDVKIGENWYKQIFYYIPRFHLIHIYGSDATERKEAEQKLRESELKYRSLFNKMSEGYALHEIILDRNKKPIDYRFLDFNPAFEELTGLKRNMMGKTIRQISPQTDLSWIRDYGRVALSGKPTHFERYHKELDRYYEVFAYKTDDLQFAVLFFDITDRKRIEKEKDNFISIMSHELRNPLTPILTGSKLILSQTQKDLKNPANEVIRKYAEIIERQSKNMAILLDDLLDIARLSHKKMFLNKRTIDVCDTARHAIETTLPLIKDQKQTLSVSIPKRPIYMEADPVRIEQIIVNLINNASKYTRPKGRIEVKVAENKKEIEITVKDNGIGIKPEKIKKIFTLFNKSEHVPFNALGSLGIGLNITRNLVTMHKGKILVKSKGENKGSTFTILFPHSITVKKPVVKRQEIKTYKKEKKKNTRVSRILIAEDNKDIAHLMSEILTQSGYEVKVTHNGDQALKAIYTFKPDVALLDIGLPGLSGYKVAREIKREPKHHHIKLIAVTGYGQAKDKNLAREAGFNYHLTKPIDIDSLLKLLQ